MAGPKKSEVRKAQITEAAEVVFAQKGFYDATMADVAREAGVSEATIYEYFPSKEELLFSIPVSKTLLGKEMLEQHLKYIRGAAARLRSIIYHYLSFYQDHPDYAAVIMLILKQNRRFLETEAYQTVRDGYRLITRVIKEGIESGEFKPDLDPYLVRSVILGVIEHHTIRRALVGRDEDLVNIVDPLTDLIIEGIRNVPENRVMNIRLVVEPSS